MASDHVDAELRADALAVLDDIVSWRLAQARWEHVTAILRQIAAALAANDAEAVQDAVADLELTGPVRTLRIGHDGVLPPPAEVLEVRGSVVESLLPAESADGDHRNGEEPPGDRRDH